MTPDQFAYLLTLAGVIPTIWLGLAVATIPSRIGHYSKKDARFFRNVVRLNLVLGVGSEYFVLAALSRHVGANVLWTPPAEWTVSIVTVMTMLMVGALAGAFWGQADVSILLQPKEKPPLDDSGQGEELGTV